MPTTDKEKLSRDIEIAWAEILGAVRDRKIGYMYRLLNKVKTLTKARDIEA